MILIMKKFKKSEIVIYALSLMLVAAGYFNYVKFEPKIQETYSNPITENVEQYANTGDAVLVSNNEVEENSVNKQISDENTKADNNTNEQLTNSEPVEDDYYAKSKLERDKMYAEMITNYEGLINNSNISEAQKTIATQEITKINNSKNAIMICENLIKTKGFNNCVIFINDANVNVVVNVDGGLETEKVAKIQNIVSREIGATIENIHITEK